MGYDIIGDIHGQAGKLEALLGVMGYRRVDGAWRHTERKVIFVGDFVDRGPEQVSTFRLVRGMVGAGSALAVMGNHELNAIAWHTPDPDHSGEYLRPRNSPRWGEKNREQHAAFLAEVEREPALHAHIIDWFLELPLWLELPELRVVHACWHGPYMKWLGPHLREGRFLTRELLPAATREPADLHEMDNGTPSVFKAVEAITKGIEIPLPPPHTFVDKDGNRRDRVRTRWWDPTAVTYRSAALLPPALREALPDTPIPDYARVTTLDSKPVFFGHYWMTGTPALQSPSCACVDYSAGKGGPLVAYRFDGESTLSAGKFVSVP